MECDSVREAISARIDGEDPGLPGAVIDAHLAGCAACRGWQQRAYTMTRRARLGGSFLEHDLTARVLAAVPPVPAGRRRRLGQRAGLIAVALAQLAVTVPLLILGHDHDAGTHAAHELGSFDLALAIAFAVGAIRPALSAGLAWPCCIAAAGLTGTAVIDLIGGQTFGADEAQHLIAVAGAALLFWQARTVRARTSGPAHGGLRAAGQRACGRSGADHRPAVGEAASVSGHGRRPQHGTGHRGPERRGKRRRRKPGGRVTATTPASAPPGADEDARPGRRRGQGRLRSRRRRRRAAGPGQQPSLGGPTWPRPPGRGHRRGRRGAVRPERDQLAVADAGRHPEPGERLGCLARQDLVHALELARGRDHDRLGLRVLKADAPDRVVRAVPVIPCILDGDGRLVRGARLRQPEAVVALVLLRYLLGAFGGIEGAGALVGPVRVHLLQAKGPGRECAPGAFALPGQVAGVRRGRGPRPRWRPGRRTGRPGAGAGRRGRPTPVRTGRCGP